ncbi:cell division protein SepF [Acaryochloris marina NIES-2412]
MAQRIIDVLSGSVDILSGQVVKVGNGVFLYSLSDIEVSAFRKHLAA